MIDLHTHILPGLDDGPYSMEESVEMALAAYRDGTRVYRGHSPQPGRGAEVVGLQCEGAV